MTRKELETIRQALLLAAAQPNAGYPKGIFGWADRVVYHGTSAASARDIIENGVDLAKCTPGYFGQAFHAAEDAALARSNYAEMADDQGAVLAATVLRGSRILDLRNGADWEVWLASGLDKKIGQEGFHRLAMCHGIDGIYDRSMGGLAIFDPGAVSVRGFAPGYEFDTSAAPQP